MPIQVQGQTIDSPSEMPNSRKFRNNWVLNGDVITVDLQAAKDTTAQEIRRRWRNWKQKQPFDFDGGKFDSGPDSRDLITGGLQLAQIQGASFSKDWIDDDDVPHTLDQAGMQALFAALAQHIDDCFQASQAKKVEIQAASTVDVLEAIVQAMQDEMGDDA